MKTQQFELERDFENYLIASNQKENYNPLYPWFCLLSGILSTVISLLWIIHIIVYMLITEPPASEFLNAYLMWYVLVKSFARGHMSVRHHYTLKLPAVLSSMGVPCLPRFDAWFPTFGVLSLAFFAGYLYACVVAGLFKFGIRVRSPSLPHLMI